MAIFTVSAADVSLKSTWKVVYGGGNTYYMSPTPSTATAERYFSFAGIPAGSVIHSATLYGTLGSPSTGAAIRTVNGTTFNGSMAVSASVGGGFTATFRFKANGTTSLPTGDRSSVLNITNIYISVDYTPPSSNPGTLSLNKSSLTAGETVRVSLTGADSGVTRNVTVWYGTNYGSQIGTVVTGAGNGATYYDFVVPESWCGTLMPNGTSASIAFAMVGIKGGVQVGSTSYGYLTVNLPSTAVPSIGGFTATKVLNGVPTAITPYVQGISGVTLAMTGVAGALGSTISSYSISGGGFSKTGVSSTTFSPLMNAGDITFTATIVDSRGRTASKTVTITVTGYTLPSIASPSAWRAADSAGTPSDEGSWVICSGTAVWTAIAGNSLTFQSRVYEKGTTPSAWVATSSGANKAHGGSLLHTKQYMAEIRVADLIGEAVWSVQIASSAVAFDIAPGATGMGLGEYAESGKLKVAWPIYAQGAIYSDGKGVLTTDYCPYGVGDILVSITATSPATRWPGTAWSAIPADRFIRTVVGSGAGGTGGSDSHVHSTSAMTLTLAQIPYHRHVGEYVYNPAFSGAGYYAYMLSGNRVDNGVVGYTGGGGSHGHGNTGSASNVPQYYTAYAWRRTS